MTTAGRSRIRPELNASSWKRLRPWIKARDGNVCRDCGGNGWIAAHVTRGGRWVPGRYRLVVGHRTPAERYAGHHDDPANLKLQCQSCQNSQRDLTDAEWQAAKAARGEADRTTVRHPFRGRRSMFTARVL